MVAASSASATTPADGDFVMLTYNVAGLPQGISGSDPETNSPLISPLLNAYDLVLLQEDWRDPVEGGPNLFYHEEIVSEADHPYKSEPAPPPMGTDLRRFPKGPALIADGLNRLSRFPFGPLERHMWDACFGEFALEAAEAIIDALGLSEPVDESGIGTVIEGGSADCGAQKGFSFARTRLAEGAEVDVYNLHGDAGGDPRDAAARTSNFSQLAAFIRTHSAGRAVIIGGDTNLRTDAGPDGRAEDRPIWARFKTETGLSDVCDLVECAQPGLIDKVAFRNGGGVTLTPVSRKIETERFTREDGEPLSDHEPVAVAFTWRSADADGTGGVPVLPLTGGAGDAPIVAVILVAIGVLGRRWVRAYGGGSART